MMPRLSAINLSRAVWRYRPMTRCMKASHNFNLLDARGVISVTERQAYIGRVRALAKACAEAWLANEVARKRRDD